MDLYDRIRALCEDRGVSFRKVETDIGIGHGSINRWHTQMPKASTLQKRDIPLPDQLSTLVQNSLKSSNRTPQGHICFLSEKTMKRRWKVLKRKMGNAPDLVPYCLRHTFCTDLQKKGIDVRVAQKLMGHSKIELTATIYSHLDEDLFTITFDRLNA